MIELWSDGACSGDQTRGKGMGKGPGGWAVVIDGPTRMVLSGYEEVTTSNRMELTAVCEGLEALGDSSEPVTIHTDSRYVKNAFGQGWVKSWQRNGWRASGGSKVANRDLWERLIGVAAKHRITWRHVKGHRNSELNNLADQMAVAAKQSGQGVVELL